MIALLPSRAHGTTGCARAASWRAGLLLALCLVSCALPSAKAPEAPARVDLPHAFAEAFRADAAGEPRGAVAAYLAVVASAVDAKDDPWQVGALQASVAELATRVMPSLGGGGRDAALAARTGERSAIEIGLVRASRRARGPFAKGLVARGLLAMAQRWGDANDAEVWRMASGCAREALVTGPTTWAPVTGVDDPGPLDRVDAPIASAYPTGDALGAELAPVRVRDRGCGIDLSAAGSRPGVREVVVDVAVSRAQTIGVALRAHGAATLRVGGLLAIRRPFELGDGQAAQFARVSVPAGTVRVVARVGTAKTDDTVELDFWDEDGGPLQARAPAAGSAAPGRALESARVSSPSPQRDDEVLLVAAAALAADDAREAEQVLWPAAVLTQAPPGLALLYGRAVEAARDLSPAVRTERARGAYERALDVWPSNWEAAVAHATLAGARRGHDEAGVETLRDLALSRAKQAEAKSPLLDAFEARIAGRERLFDRAKSALDRARSALGATALFADAEDEATPRSGAELVAAECDPARAGGHDTLGCFDALRASGRHADALAEIGRLRQLFGAPLALLGLELREALSTGDRAAFAAAWDKQLPGARTLTGMAAPGLLAGEIDSAATLQLLRAAPEMRDAPASVGPLLRFAGDDPARELEGRAELLVAQDRASSILPAAATAVLGHIERYDIGANGLMRWLLFDVRRVSGTTDVEENAQAAPPELWGRGAARTLRRRIFKRDGRVLEPEQPPRASQAHADLAQLEQGDVVEAIYEGWLLPGDTGDIGIDTTDLLPERTAVHEATIELRLPRSLRGSLWSHRLLGKAAERVDGDARVLTWHIVDQSVRRIEDGVPKMDRSAGVSFSTAEWSGVARALRETLAGLQEHDPEIAAWARSVAGSDAGRASRATIDSVVAAAGSALREADPSVLSDYGGAVAPAQSRTARSFLSSHEGSRSWLIVRALRELGIPCDVVVAENEPFSADPSFPPHFGRFAHPLVVAHLAPADVWIDADIPGPPLPAGRISPELRGRLALGVDGGVTSLPALGTADERDEVDLRLALDSKGNARGTLAVVLRGREAQSLSEAFYHVVGAERQRALRDVVLAWLPWGNVDRVELSSTEGSWQVGLRADVSVSGYAQFDGGKTWLLPGLDTLHWSVPHARVSTLGATFATRAGRESALALSTAVQYHVHRRLELPKGASVTRLPGPIDLSTKLVEASRAIAIGAGSPGPVVEDDFVLGVATGTVASSDYAAFVAVTRTADDGFLATTGVTLLP